MNGKSKAKTPEEYISMIDEPRKGEIQNLHNLIRKTVPDLKPYMQSGMIGYGKYQYKYSSGREGEWFLIGLASNKSYISIYACSAYDNGYVAEKYKNDLPKASIGKSCIRFKKVEDIDLDVLKNILLEVKEVGGVSEVKS